MTRIKLISFVILAFLIAVAVAYQPIPSAHTSAAAGPPPDGVPTVPFYRLVAPATGIHFYTTDVNRKLEAIGTGGWKSEGNAVHILSQQAPGTVPLYVLVTRLRFDLLSGDAVFGYTTDPQERDNLLQSKEMSDLLGGYVGPRPNDGHAWSLDGTGIAGYIASTQLPGTVPLYRLYHPPHFGPEEKVDPILGLGGFPFRKCLPGSYDNFYTTSEKEKAHALTSSGYKFIRIEGYVWPAATTVGGPPKVGPGKPVGDADTVLLKWGCTRPGAGSYNCPTTAGYEACANYRAKGEVKACSTSANQKVQEAMEKMLFNVGCSRFMNRPDQFVCKTQKSFDLCETYRKNGTAKKCLLTTK